MGGEIRFRSALTGIQVEKGQITGIEINNREQLPVSTLVLAIGHSARDTFSLLEKTGCSMQAKSFAVGLRIEHPQTLINQYQYGCKERKNSATVPGPAWAPIVAPIGFIITFVMPNFSSTSFATYAASSSQSPWLIRTISFLSR